MSNQQQPTENGRGARNRGRRKLPDFMYGDNFPTDRIGAGGATYGGAVDWLTKHRDDFETAMRCIQRYPNIIQEPCLDNFWDFVEPLVYNNALLLRYDQFLRSQFGFAEDFRLGAPFQSSSGALPTAARFFKSDAAAAGAASPSSDYEYPLRRVFFCCPPSVEHAALRRDVLDALLPLCCVRTNCRPEQAPLVSGLDVCRALCGGTLVMVLCDATLADDVCMHALRIAIAYGSPVVFVREAGYELPGAAAAELLPDDEVELARPPADAPFVPQRNGLAVRGPAAAAAADTAERQTVSVAEVLRRCFAESVVYNPKMADVSVNLLLGRLASVVGAGSSRQSGGVGAPSDSSAAAAAADLGAASTIEPPVRVGSATAPRKLLHRIGSARTTVTFEQAYAQAAPATAAVAAADAAVGGQ